VVINPATRPPITDLPSGVFASLPRANPKAMGSRAKNAAKGDFSPGMGGAMDLVRGAQKIVCTLQHNDKKGESKILKKCQLAITGRGVVNVIITEKAVFNVVDGSLVLVEKDPALSVEDLKACTEAEFTVSPDIKDYRMSGINA